eukprot:752396-Hanusia_phi.AAC.1
MVVENIPQQQLNPVAAQRLVEPSCYPAVLPLPHADLVVRKPPAQAPHRGEPGMHCFHYPLLLVLLGLQRLHLRLRLLLLLFEVRLLRPRPPRVVCLCHPRQQELNPASPEPVHRDVDSVVLQDVCEQPLEQLRSALSHQRLDAPHLPVRYGGGAQRQSLPALAHEREAFLELATILLGDGDVD